jgi:hypothetical protein
MQRMDAETTRDGVDSTLYDRFAMIIFTYLCQQVSHEQDAEDLLVEIFLTILLTFTLNLRYAETRTTIAVTLSGPPSSLARAMRC